MVAGAQKADLLADLAASVDRAIVEGKSLESFRQDFRAAVDRHDWHGWTGEDTKGGTAWRTRTIYRTNTYVSYAAGRRAQLQSSNWPFWVYVHGGSRDPRPEHLYVFNGLVLPPDHPFWITHYPPSDWGCSCYVVGARSERGARRLGGDPARKLPDGWNRMLPATGEPLGVGKGWGYAPGASVAGPVSAIAGKIGAWDYQIGKAFMSEMPPAARDAIADAYRRLPSVQADLTRFAQRTLDDGASEGGDEPETRTIGALTTAAADQIGSLIGRDVAGYDYSIERSAIGHVEARHGAAERDSAQRPVQAADYGRLPAVLDQPDSVSALGKSDTGLAVIEYRRTLDGEDFVARFEVRGKKRRTLALKTFFIKQ
nr:phage minor head protein [Sphingomonas sp. CROZ-RG-20F-R02-07]